MAKTTAKKPLMGFSPLMQPRPRSRSRLCSSEGRRKAGGWLSALRSARAALETTEADEGVDCGSRHAGGETNGPHPQALVELNGGVDEMRPEHEDLYGGQLLPEDGVDVLHAIRLKEQERRLQSRIVCPAVVRPPRQARQRTKHPFRCQWP